jgi:DNA-binding CsgD family transcriptional regulator
MASMGYESALTLLEGLFAECAADHGRVVLIEGGLAGGKTHLLHDFSRKVIESGAARLYATGSRAERALQMGVIDQLFRNVGPVGAPDDGRSRLAFPDIHGWDESAGENGAHAAAIAGRVREVCDELLELSRDKPLIVIVDDIHFADAASLRVLLALQKRMKTAPLMLVLSEWTRSHPASPEFHAELTRHPYFHIRLRLPSAPETGALIRGSLGVAHVKADIAKLADAYHELTGGNPLLVQALLDDDRAGEPSWDGADPAELPVGAHYARAVLACLHRWEPQLADVAQAVAILGDWATPDLIGRLVGIGAEPIKDIVAILTEAGLLSDLRFRHRVARRAVLASIHPATRAVVHARAANLLFQSGALPAHVADHLLAAGRVDEPWAQPVLRAAAEEALAQGDTATAVRCLQLALGCCPDKKERIAVINALVRALWRMNPVMAAPYLAELREAVQDGELGGRDAAAVVRYSLWKGDGEAASKTLGALMETQGLADPQSVAELAVTYRWFFGPDRDMPDKLVLDRSARTDMWADATNRLATLWTRGGMDAAATSARHILQSCRLEDTPIDVVAMAFLALLGSGKLDLARFWCERLTREASQRNEVTWQAVLSEIDAHIALRQGDPAATAIKARTALDMLQPPGWGVLIGMPKSTLLLAYAAMGTEQPAAGLLRPPDEQFSTVFCLRYLHARGHYFLATGQPLAASRDFQLCGKLMREREVDVPALVPWRSDLAEANLTLGRITEARDLVRQQLAQVKMIEQAKTTDTRTRGISLRVLATTIELAQRPAHLRRAVEYLQTAGDRLELSRALTALSSAYHELGQSDRARDCARRAAQLIPASAVVPAQRGSRRPAVIKAVPAGSAEADAGQERNGGSARRPAQDAARPVLSGAELRVVELAALGHTNREISRDLYITVSTVEQHLTHAYRKLGISTRADLQAELMRAKAGSREPEPSRAGPRQDGQVQPAGAPGHLVNGVPAA